MKPLSPEPHNEPLPNPMHEVFCIERAAGMAVEDAGVIISIDDPMPPEAGEFAPARRNRVQRQALRRLNTRLKLLALIERGLGEEDHAFLLRNRRAAAELTWARDLVVCGGLEPEYDEGSGRLLTPWTKQEQSASTTNGGVTP